MLRAAVQKCPRDHWNNAAHDNRFWRIAYHTLFYTHLYLSPSEEKFEPWEKALPDYPYLGRRPWPPFEETVIGDPYTQTDILDYCALIMERVPRMIAAIPMESASGFPWIPFSRFELHLYNIRHIQHHTGQLIDRLRSEARIGIDWVGMNNTEE